ncbi:MAG: TetR/AcrR family transcriptional regulator [Sphingobium sp.]|nr:TetR/AcrR family transcriptional regulator [Sphingobium sp.]
MTELSESWRDRTKRRVQLRETPTAVGKGELRKSGETRARILDAGINCLVSDGYPRLSLAAVAARAGMTRASIIYHFAGREALLEAIVTHLFDKRLDLYWDAVREVPDDAARIATFVEAYWHQVESDLFIAFVELIVAARTDRALRQIVAPALERFDARRRDYSHLIFSHEMRAVAGDRFEVVRDVARFLIEGMAFAAMTTRLDPGRIDGVKGFLIAQMEAAYRGK